MKLSLSLVIALAFASPLAAAELLVPTVVGPWEPLTTGAPPVADGEQVAEPNPGSFYLFFEKAAPTPAQPRAGAGSSSTQRSKTEPPVTRVYHSIGQKDFGVNSPNADAMRLVATFPVVRAKVWQRDGKWFLAGRAPGSDEVRVVPLEWKPVTPPTPATDASRKPGIKIRVALYDDSGSAGKGVPSAFEQLRRCADIEVVKLDAGGIRAGLSGYDVVIFTGGSGSRQANTIGLLGREQVRRFVEAGGGYIGICAGAYLACDGFSWGVKVLDAKTPSPKWARGIGDLEMEATPDGQKVLGLPVRSIVRYANGPVLVPANNPAIPDFEPLVFFRTELARNGAPVGVQVNTPAIARGTFGKGRVIACSPHPEQTAGMERWIENAVRAVASVR